MLLYCAGAIVSYADRPERLQSDDAKHRARPQRPFARRLHPLAALKYYISDIMRYIVMVVTKSSPAPTACSGW